MGANVGGEVLEIEEVVQPSDGTVVIEDSLGLVLKVDKSAATDVLLRKLEGDEGVFGLFINVERHVQGINGRRQRRLEGEVESDRYAVWAENIQVAVPDWKLLAINDILDNLGDDNQEARNALV